MCVCVVCVCEYAGQHGEGRTGTQTRPHETKEWSQLVFEQCRLESAVALLTLCGASTAYASNIFTLEPGDVILTGTPEGAHPPHAQHHNISTNCTGRQKFLGIISRHGKLAIPEDVKANFSLCAVLGVGTVDVGDVITAGIEGHVDVTFKVEART